MVQIYTSYWAQLKKVEANDLTPVCISRKPGYGFKGEKFTDLYPTWAMVKNTDGLSDADWEKAYIEENLGKLDRMETAKALEGKVLMCWEGRDKFCHRQCVAKWLEQQPGVTVTELVFS